jgi:hypothetical protein
MDLFKIQKVKPYPDGIFSAILSNLSRISKMPPGRLESLLEMGSF